MTIKPPDNAVPLRRLWQHIFGDTDRFLDDFFARAYSPERCRCVYEEDQLAAMLFWFNCAWEGQRIAYLYAVATDEAFRGRGFCKALMADTHSHLKKLGYAGCILVPGEPALFDMYEKMGYRTCGAVTEFTCEAGAPIPLEPINARYYAALRASCLPEGGVIEEGPVLSLLSTYASFYLSDSSVCAARQENGKLTVYELLGDAADAPGIVAALGCQSGTFRVPGDGRPFAMYYSLTGSPAPGYFGLALD